MIISKSGIKLYIGELGKRDNKDKILIGFHEHNVVACVTAEGDSTITMRIQWVTEKAGAK